MMVASPHPAMAVRDFPSAAPRTKTSLGVAAGLSVGLLAVLWFAGSGSLLRLAIPAIATFFALLLYFRYPILYVQYSLWVWFLAPLARRIVDWRFGFQESSIVLATPVLVSGLVGLTFLRKGTKAWCDLPPAFVLCGTAIFYGFAVGMFQRPSPETVFALLNWFSPLLFGLHLYQNWPQYERYRDAILATFVWGVLVLGIYGIYQYFAPAGWDRYWLDNVRLDGTGVSFGESDSMMVRIWSTMNSPGPFANTMMVGLLVLFAARSLLKLPAAIAGYVSFLLSGVRTSWLGWIVAMVCMLRYASSKVIVRLVLSVTFLLVCLVPVVIQPEVAGMVGDRIKTLTDLKHDESFGTRLEMYQILINDAMHDPFGQGIKNPVLAHGVAVDSGILSIVFSMGWLGGILFGAGLVSVFLRQGRGLEKDDEFVRIAKAAMVALLSQTIGGNVFVGVIGMTFWSLTGMWMAGYRHFLVPFEDLGAEAQAA